MCGSFYFLDQHRTLVPSDVHAMTLSTSLCVGRTVGTTFLLAMLDAVTMKKGYSSIPKKIDTKGLTI